MPWEVTKKSGCPRQTSWSTSSVAQQTEDECRCTADIGTHLLPAKQQKRLTRHTTTWQTLLMVEQQSAAHAHMPQHTCTWAPTELRSMSSAQYFLSLNKQCSQRHRPVLPNAQGHVHLPAEGESSQIDGLRSSIRSHGCHEACQLIVVLPPDVCRPANASINLGS